MGKDARFKAERRRLRQAAGRPLDLLRDLFQQIQRQTSESPRRCWEMMLEIVGHLSGINCLRGGCLTPDSERVLRSLQVGSLLEDYVESWDAELQLCQEEGRPITDPLGTILEEIGGTNEALDQYFTPPAVVRVMNQVTISDLRARDGGRFTALDLGCGTGRYALDALVHCADVMTFNVDIDLWMVRAALVNFRFASRFSCAKIEAPSSGSDGLFTEESAAALRKKGFGQPESPRGEALWVLGGRSWILNADSSLVDLQCSDNWKYSWMWNPPPWQSSMKLADFDGTYDEWVKQRPAREVERRRVRIEAAHQKDLVDLKLDEAALHAHMIQTMKDVDGLVPGGDQRSGLDGLRPVRQVSVLAGNEPGLPRLRRGPR